MFRKAATSKSSGGSRNTFTINNFNKKEQDSLLHENNYIEMDTIETTTEPNGVINRSNGRANEPNGLTNGVNTTEVTGNTQSNDRDSLKLILLRILNELKHSTTGDNLRRKEDEDWLTFIAFLDKVLFYVFLVLFIIILIVLVITLLL